MADIPEIVKHSEPDAETGYRTFQLGSFTFKRDEYFAYIQWQKNGKTITHTKSCEDFLRPLVRDVAWNFFYGQINFDEVFGTNNHYGEVEVFAGSYNPAFKDTGNDLMERFDGELVLETFKAMLDDWVNAGYDPFAAPRETGTSWQGKKNGSNPEAIFRKREACQRMPGLEGDIGIREDLPVNEAFADVDQSQPEVHAEPGFEKEISAFNLFGYLSRSQVTWNPSVVSACRGSLFCPTTEEYTLPVIHGNDRVEWFVQLSDEIFWNVEDKETGKPLCKLLMKPGDVAAMPANIRHVGMARKRSMLLVWENADPGVEDRFAKGEVPPYPVEF